MKNSDSKRQWLLGSVMGVVFLGIPLLAGGAFESGSIYDPNKVKFKVSY